MRPRALGLCLGVAAALLAACRGGGARDEASHAVVSVQVAPVVQGDLQHWVRGEAVLAPLNQATITPRITAPVARFYVQRGSRVTAGETLADLENHDLAAAAAEAQSEFETAQANYQTATGASLPEELKKAELDAAAAHQGFEQAQRVYDSRQTLFDQGALPQRDLQQSSLDLTDARNADQLAAQRLAALQAVGNTQAIRAAQGEMDAAQARAQAAAAQLAYSHIQSPISGVVTERPLYAGETATDTAPLLTVMDLSQVVAKANLPVAAAAQLKVGDAAQLTPVGGGQPVGGRVTVVSPATDPGSTTVQVWVQAANPGDALRPGIPVAVAVLAETLRNVLTIPTPALLVEAGGPASVMVAGGDGRAHSRNVTVGVREPDKTQILSGLKAGQRVITGGAFGLDDQTPIKIVAPPDADDDER